MTEDHANRISRLERVVFGDKDLNVDSLVDQNEELKKQIESLALFNQRVLWTVRVLIAFIGSGGLAALQYIMGG